MASSAEERREARRKKILDNSSTRINKIFGVEGKNEPGIEDGNPYLRVTRSAAAKLATSPSAVEKEPGLGFILEKNGSNGTALDEEQKMTFTPTSREAYFREGRKMWFSRRRIQAAAVLGVLMRFWLMLNIYPYIFIPWLLYQIILELVHTRSKHALYPPHGHLVDILLYLGTSQKLVRIGGRIADVVTRVLDDSVVMFLCFFVVHFVLTCCTAVK